MKAIVLWICFLLSSFTFGSVTYAAPPVTYRPPSNPPPVFNVVIPHIVTATATCDRTSGLTIVYGDYLYYECANISTVPNRPLVLYFYSPVDNPRTALYLQLLSAPYWGQVTPFQANGNTWLNVYPTDVVYDTHDDAGHIGFPPGMGEGNVTDLHRIVLVSSRSN